MMRCIPSSGIGVVLVLLASTTAAADNKTFAGDVSAQGQLTSSIKQTQLEVGLEFKWSDIVREVSDTPRDKQDYREQQLRVFARVPVDGADSTTADIDSFTSTSRIGARGMYRWDPDVQTGHWLSLQAEYGVARFKFAPNGDDSHSQEPLHHSIDLEAQYRLGMF